jgi:hypothetical protein
MIRPNLIHRGLVQLRPPTIAMVESRDPDRAGQPDGARQAVAPPGIRSRGPIHRTNLVHRGLIRLRPSAIAMALVASTAVLA